MSKTTIAIASDHAGVEMKEALKLEAQALGFGVEDLGTHGVASVDYPDFANAVCEWVRKHPGSRAVLICGSGIGMSMAANRHKGIRAALVHQGLEAQLARRHNDANILCLGARIIGIETAKDALKQFLATEFEGDRHAGRVEKMG